MPISVQDLLGDRRTIDVDTKAGKMSLTYQPSAYAAILEDVSMRLLETNRPYSSLATGLAQLVVAWDITGPVTVGRDDSGDDVLVGAEGETLPITLEVLRSLPGSLLVLMQNAINADMKPKPDEQKNSGAGSQRKAR